MAIAPIVQLDATTGALPSGDQFWLDAVTASVRKFCGWHVAPQITETIILDGTGTNVLLLPSLNVVDVTACTNDGLDVLADIQWSKTGALYLNTGWSGTGWCGGWTANLQGVSATITHGFDDASDIAGLIVDIAARMKPTSGVTSQGAGPFSFRYSGGRLPLTPDEKEILGPYRIVGIA